MKKILKLLLSIPLLIILTYIYYLIIGITLIAIFGFLASDEKTSGIWPIFVGISFLVSFILSIYTVNKLLFKKSNEEKGISR